MLRLFPNQASNRLTHSEQTRPGCPILDGSYNTRSQPTRTDEGVLRAVLLPGCRQLRSKARSFCRPERPPLFGILMAIHPGFDWIRDQTYGDLMSKKYIWSKAEGSSRGVDKVLDTRYDGLNVPLSVLLTCSLWRPKLK